MTLRFGVIGNEGSLIYVTHRQFVWLWTRRHIQFFPPMNLRLIWPHIPWWRWLMLSPLWVLGNAGSLIVSWIVILAYLLGKCTVVARVPCGTTLSSTFLADMLAETSVGALHDRRTE